MSTPTDSQRALEEALTELQAAAWARSWSRLQRARAKVADVSGLRVESPLRAALKKEAGGDEAQEG